MTGRTSTRVGIVLTLAGVALVVVAGLTAGEPVSGVTILSGALGINALIVGPFFLLRPHVERLRRFLPPWLPW